MPLRRAPKKGANNMKERYLKQVKDRLLLPPATAAAVLADL